MPSWKKIIVSGSDAELNQLTATSFGGNISGSSTSTGSFGYLEITDSGGSPTIHLNEPAGAGGDSAVRMTEDGGFRGGFIKYDGGNNVIKIGTHANNNRTVSDDITAIQITRNDGFPFFITDEVYFRQSLIHEGDTDTFIKYTTNNIDLSAGGNVFAVTTTSLSGSATSTGSFGQLDLLSNGHLRINQGGRGDEGSGANNPSGITLFQQTTFEGDLTNTANVFSRIFDDNKLVLANHFNNAGGGISLRTMAGGSQTTAIDIKGSTGLTTIQKGIVVKDSATINTDLIVTGSTSITGDLTVTGSISGSSTSTGSFGKLLGDGSDLTGVSSDVVDDTSPQLGGNLDLNSNDITGTGNIDIAGNITAQNFIVSSSVTSVTYQSLSGSTIFGDDIDDTHSFTGSLSTSGSLRVVGDVLIGSGSAPVSPGITSGQVDLLVRPNVAVGDYTTRLVVEQPNSHTYKSDAEIHVHGHNDGRLYIGGNRQRKIIFKTNAVDDAAAEAWTIGTPDDSTNFQISALNSTVQAILINKTSGDITAVGNISSSAASTGSFGQLQMKGNDLPPISVSGASILVGNGAGAVDDGSATRGNIFIGFEAGNDNTSGHSNVAIGDKAYDEGVATNDYNVAIGRDALGGNHSGLGADRTVAIGSGAAFGAINNVTGMVAIGYNSLTAVTTGKRNTALGYQSGNTITDGEDNVIIGWDADASGTGATNQIVIGRSVTGTGDNETVIGNSSQTKVTFGGDALISGSAASTGSFGRLKVDSRAIIGEAYIGQWEAAANYAIFANSELDQTVVGNYSILAQNNGNTLINAASSREITFRINNSTRATISNTLFSTTTDIQSGGNVSGSSTSTGSFGHLMVGGGNFTSASLASAIAGGGGSGISNVVEDTSPQLGGDLDLNSNDITGTGNINIAGNLTVLGTTSTISTTNIKIGDPFGFFATGSAGTNVDGGIIIQSGSAVDSGSAMYHDISTERWSVAKGIASTATTVTDSEWQGYVATVFTSSGSPVGESPKYGVGEIHIDENGDIFIYS